MVHRIEQRLRGLGPLRRGVVRVSVANETRWENSAHGTEVLVRWACWSIEDDGVEVSPPEFEVLSASVTQDRLREELPALLPDVGLVVDGDVDL